MRLGQILDFSSFRVSPESPMFGPARISRARVHVPLAGVLPQVLRQGGHHDLDPQTPNSIADVPDARARAPPRARKVLEIVKDGVVNFDEFSSRHDEHARAKSRPGVGKKKGGVPGAARRLRLRRSENGRGGARIGSARRKRDERRADDARRARDGHALRVRSSGTRVALHCGSQKTQGAVAEMRADRKRTREVVEVTRMHVEMVGTPRGVPLVRSFGASVVLCDAQVAVSAGDGFTFSSTTRDESGGCAAQTAARGVEGEARARDEQVGIAYARAEALRSRVDVGRARRRSARTAGLVEYETKRDRTETHALHSCMSVLEPVARTVHY